MATKRGVVDWIDILDDETDRPPVVYRRKAGVSGAKSCRNQEVQAENEDPAEVQWDDQPVKRKSHRGRKSIASTQDNDSKPGLKGRGLKKKPKPRFPNKRVEAPPTEFVKEKKTYFQEVDSFELDEEDMPSPKNKRNNSLGEVSNRFPIPNLLSGLDVVWEDSWGETYPQTPKDGVRNGSDLLSLILQTPSSISQSSASSDLLISSDGVSFHKVNSSKRMSQKERAIEQDATSVCSSPDEVTAESADNSQCVQDNADTPSSSNASSISEAFENMQIADVHSFEKMEECATIREEEEGDDDHDDEKDGLSAVEEPLLPSISDEDEADELHSPSFVKIGEGTFGEAFKGGGNVFKIVPIDGDILVNGEVQKTCAELFVEVLLSRTLNSLRKGPTVNKNGCVNFIETKAIRVCEGTYDACLVNAWEDWDEKHSSENDHPMAFPEKQLYVTFILADGGKDLESFVLSDFDEARSLLIQVTASLAVAEAACEFEHRDLHWSTHFY